MIEQPFINPYKYPCKFYLKVEFPAMIQHNGKTYWRTGKEGTKINTDIPSAEYSTYNSTKGLDERVWLDAHANVTEE
jgi:hypothetical protein